LKADPKAFTWVPVDAHAGDDVEGAIAIHVAGSHVHTARKARVVGKESGDHIAPFAVRHLHAGTNAEAGGHNDDFQTITIESAIGDRTLPLSNTNALNFRLMMPEVFQNKIRPSPSTPGEVTKT